jgi:hypothetical protein
MIIVPLFFKDNILEKAQEEANKNLNAKIEIGDVSLSMFSEFPNLSIEITDIILSGKDEFKNDTLAMIASLGAGINLSSLISGDAIKTTDIYINNAYFNTIINTKGNTNWDIVSTTSETVNIENEESIASSLNVIFGNIHFNNINIDFTDKKENTYFSSKGINIGISGNFSEENTNINFSMSSDNTNLSYGGIEYLEKGYISFEAKLAANLKEQIFKFQENKFLLNKLELSMNGSIDMNKDDMLLDLKLQTNNNDFKTLLSMIPGEFKKDIKDLKTSGEVHLSAFAKGKMTNKILPSFGAKLKVENAKIQYPKLPESIDNIKIQAEVYNPGGIIDNTIVNITDFHLDIAKNPFDFKLMIKNPISDAKLKGDIIAKIDFNKIKKAIPLEDVKIGGFVDANISFDGRMSYIEKEKYDLFKTKGKINLKNFIYEGKEVPMAFRISKAVLAFSSKQISLQSFNAKIGSSDISLKGNIKNYIPYALKGKTLIADFSMYSNKLNINELMPKENKEKVNNKEDTPLSVIEIPGNLNLKLRCNIKSMLYDKLVITNTNGLISVKDSKANLNDLKMNMLEGSVKMNGEYNAKNINIPKIGYKLAVNNIDLKSTYSSFSIIKEMVPMAMNCSGKISMNMMIKSNLSKTMTIIPSTLNGQGNISSRKILINKNQLLDGLAKLVKDDSYKKISIEKLDMNVLIKNGNITLKPFTTNIAGNKTRIYGTQSVDGKLNYHIDSSVPKKMLGSGINRTFNNIPGYKSLKKINIGLKIGGTLSKPSVKPDLSRAKKQIAKAAKKEIETKGKKEAKKLLEKEIKKIFDKKTQKKAKDLLNKLF